MIQFFGVKYQWQSVYQHHQKWCKDGSWERVWHILNKYKHFWDMSSIQLGSTHTPVKRGVQAVTYHGSKKSKTSYMLILTDNRDIPLACNALVETNHNGVFNLVPTEEKISSI